jgi:hypothetical protein
MQGRLQAWLGASGLREAGNKLSEVDRGQGPLHRGSEAPPES